MATQQRRSKYDVSMKTLYKHRISYLTGTCYNFEIEEFFS